MAENKTTNAKYIYSFFKERGWTDQSICGMLGNMEGESGIIADLDEYSGGGGYGLVQWTPKSKLTIWADANGYDYRTVETQCKRIQWELENGEQFYAKSAYPMNFKQFTQSTYSPTYLAEVFINNYERPANPVQPQRGVWAETWYSVLVGGASVSTDPSTGSTTVSNSGLHTVISGDTLSSIAAKYGVTVANLQAWNGISNANYIQVGQVLVVKESTTSWSTTTNAAGTHTVVSGDTLSAIAVKYSVTVAQLQAWNGITNANAIQIGLVLIVAEPKTSTYTVKSGDTLSAIAIKFGVTVADLQAWNGIANANVISIGQALIVSSPTLASTTTYTYTVVSGDTLSAIATKYGVTVANLQSWNGITNANAIQVGQVLRLTAPITSSTTPATSITYIVKSGDTLSAIATKYGVTVANLQAWNGISNANIISIGQILNVAAPTTVTYTVKSGDTLSAIAVKYGVTVAQLKSWNGISNADLISIGQVLRVG